MARVILSAAGGMTNPMSLAQDLIVGGASGNPGRLGVGSNGQVLTVTAGVVGWANAASGFSNPMSIAQDMIVASAGGTAQRLGVGSNGQVLTVVGGNVQWSSASMVNPMTTNQDIVVGGSTGNPGRLGVGSNGQVLTVTSGLVTWANSASGFGNPMTTAGDLIVGTTFGTAQRLAAGSTGQVLTISGGLPTWAAASGGGGSAPTIVSAGNLGATYTLTLSSTETWLIGTLNANNALTISGLTAGYWGRLLLSQDATGGRTLSVNGTSVQIASTASAFLPIIFEYDGTNLYVTMEGGAATGGGGGGAVSSVFTRTGAVVAASGDYTAAQVTNAADKSSGSQQAFTGEVKAPDFTPAGLTGATTASRYVGGTVSGAPASGTFVVGDWVSDQSGKRWICTTAGSPGTWTQEPGTGGAPTIVSPGNLGATYTLTLSSTETWLIGTLNANNALTISGLTAGYSGRLLLTQDATGGRTLTVNGTSIAISTTASVTSALVFEYDGTNLYVTLDGGSGGSGSGGLPSVGSTSTSLHVNSSGSLQYTADLGLNVMDYGAVGDARLVTDAAITASTATLSSTQAAFTSADTGKAINVVGAGAAGVVLSTTISSVSAGVATLATTAGTTVSGATANYGTNDATPLQNAINAANTVWSKTGATVNVVLPSGLAFFLGTVNAKNGVRLWCYGATIMANLGAVVSSGTSSGLINYHTAGSILQQFSIFGGYWAGTNAENGQGVFFRSGGQTTGGGCTDCTFRDMYINNWGAAPIGIGNPRRCAVLNCTLINPGVGSLDGANSINFVFGDQTGTMALGECIAMGNIVETSNAAGIAAVLNVGALWSGSANCIFTNNYTSGYTGGTQGSSGAIYAENDTTNSWDSFVIANNIINAHAMGTAGAISVGTGGSSTGTTTKALVSGNRVSLQSGATGHGIALGNPGTTLEVEIVNNNFAGIANAISYRTGNPPIVQTGNRLSLTGPAQGRATLVAGTVTVSTAEIQTGDNVFLTVVVPGGTRGLVQLGTITAGTSFVINSIQPGTASTVQTSDTSTVFWQIVH